MNTNITIELVATKGTVGELIRVQTRCMYNHTGFVCDEDWHGLMHDMLDNYRTPNSGAIHSSLASLPSGDYGAYGAHDTDGVMIRPTNPSQYSHRAVYQIPLNSPEDKRKIMTFALEQLGKPYDMGAIAGLLLHRDWRNPYRWFCSEVLEASMETAKPLLNKDCDVDRVTPRDIWISPELNGRLVSHF